MGGFASRATSDQLILRDVEHRRQTLKHCLLHLGLPVLNDLNNQSRDAALCGKLITGDAPPSAISHQGRLTALDGVGDLHRHSESVRHRWPPREWSLARDGTAATAWPYRPRKSARRLRDRSFEDTAMRLSRSVRVLI